jgi:hypothetical protein
MLCADGTLGAQVAFDGSMGATAKLYVGCSQASINHLSGNIGEVHVERSSNRRTDVAGGIMTYEWEAVEPAMNSVVAMGKTDTLDSAEDTVILAAKQYDKDAGGTELLMYINDGKQVLRTEWPDADAGDRHEQYSSYTAKLF